MASVYGVGQLLPLAKVIPWKRAIERRQKIATARGEAPGILVGSRHEPFAAPNMLPA